MLRWIGRHWLLLVFALVNVAIARPARATMGDNFCYDDEGTARPCCTLCVGNCMCHAKTTQTN
jgi:hypothetical protein